MSLEFLLQVQEEFFALATWHDAAFRSDTGLEIRPIWYIYQLLGSSKSFPQY